MIQNLFRTDGMLIIPLVVIAIVALLFFGVTGILAVLFLPRLILALGIGIIGVLFLLQKIPIVSGAYSWIVAVICWAVAYIIGTGVIPIA